MATRTTNLATDRDVDWLAVKNDGSSRIESVHKHSLHTFNCPDSITALIVVVYDMLTTLISDATVLLRCILQSAVLY